MGFQDTFNQRVVPAIERAFGATVKYRRGAELLELVLPFGRRDTDTTRRALAAELGIVAETREFVVQTEQLNISGTVSPPEAGDEITWIDSIGLEQRWTVFPLVGEKCFRFLENTETRLRVYAVTQEALQPLEVTLATGIAAFTINAIPSVIRGAADYSERSNETRILTTEAYVARADMTAKGVNQPPSLAYFKFLGLDDWMIDMNRTEWGQGLVKVGLQRETSVREWQGRRNATV